INDEISICTTSRGRSSRCNHFYRTCRKRATPRCGAKMHHLAPNTSSSIVSKSISKDGGKVSYRGIVHFGRKADGARANIECDTLILDDESFSDTIPYNEIYNDNISLEHEAK